MKERTRVREALDRLESRLEEPRALEPSAEERAGLVRALERARTQLCEELPPVLITALAGGTGVGKSTLINALAGADIAETSEERPTTTSVRVYHHRDVPDGGLPGDLEAESRRVEHGREELRWKVLVDTPDLDSFVRDHRARTRRLLRASGLVLYVFSPEKYMEERLWSVLREERCFSAAAAVLNKADSLPAVELDQITEDLRAKLASVGLAGVRVFRTCARAHVPGAEPPRTAPPGIDEPMHAVSSVDETGELRAYLERELRQGEATRIVREQRSRTLRNLRVAVERLAPEELSGRLERLEVRIAESAREGGLLLADVVGSELRAVEEDLAPLATLRQHERFHGPFRAWLAFADFLSIGLRGIVDRLVGRPPRGTVDALERVLSGGRDREVEGLLRAQERGAQDLLYDAGLPVARWREAAGGTGAPELLGELAREVREGFEARASRGVGRGGALVWAVSAVGALVPAALVLAGLGVLIRDLVAGSYGGWALMGHLLALTLLLFLALHGLVSLLLSGGLRLGRGLGAEAARRILPRAVERWLAAYRGELEADLAGLRDPLEVLERELASELAEPEEDEPSAREGESPIAWAAAEPEPPPEDEARPGEGGEVEPRGPSVDPEERMRRALEGGED